MESLPKGSFCDLTLSNPTQCGFDYPTRFLQCLSDPRSSTYEPHPFGTLDARKAVTEYLKRTRNERIDPENVILTSSTSEAYAYLFKLLGDPGDSILVPAPGYPLLDHLVRLEGLEPLPYPLQKRENWPVNLLTLSRDLHDRIKALVAVTPHNPTGSYLSPHDQKNLVELCSHRGMSLLLDEVFAEYAYPGHRPTAPPGTETLVFRLGGLSKCLGLPQLKVSWIIASGPPGPLREGLERLELIADNYLSVNTPVQTALKELLAFAPHFQTQVLSRVLSNRSSLKSSVKDIEGVRVWPAQGGWYA